MRLLHLSDLHLGKYVLEAPMLDDQREFLAGTAAYAAAHRMDGVLLAGDVYDRSVPPAEAVSLFDGFLSALHEAGIPVFLIAGNHDSPERLAFGSRLFAGQGVYMAGVYDGTVPAVELRDEYGPLILHLLPFLRPVDVREALGVPASTTDEAVRAALAVSPPDPAVRHVLLAHQFVCAGGQAPDTCDSETPAVGGSDPVDVSAFDGYDYVALGHLHRAQRVGRDTVRYAGSPLRYSLSEVSHPKSFTVVTLAEKGRVEAELVPITPRRQLRKIEGAIDRLLMAGREDGEGREDYIWAVLDEEALNPAERLRAVYPNLLHVEVAARRREDEEEAEEAQPIRTPGELFAAFYKEMTGADLTAAQEAALADSLQAAQTAGEEGSAPGNKEETL